MSTFPSILTTYTNPLATDKLNSPSHSGIETSQNGGLTQVEAVIGVEGASSVVGSLQYLIKSPASDGGGHVQSANKGGTGQTTYNKGDLLVASSTSVLSKLAVGLDGRALVANSSVASGLEYKGVATEKQLQDQTYTYAVASVLSGSVWGITFPNIVSVLSAGQSFAVKFPTANTSSAIALQISSLTALRIRNPNLTNPAIGDIAASMIGIVENDGTQLQLVSRNATNTGVTYTNGTTTKNSSDASTTQNIAHGLGVIPKKVKLTFTNCVITSIAISEVAYNGTTQSSTSFYLINSGAIQVNNALIIANDSGSGGYNTGVVTFDATNIIITWTLSGSTASTTYQVLWEAEA